MRQFMLSESRALDFHRAALDAARSHPEILEHARAALPRLRARQPAFGHVFDRWEGLLDKSIDEMSPAVLANDPDGGLLRANSPLEAGLRPDERNVIWRRVGLGQFVGMFRQAAEELGLTVAEQAAVAGLPEAEVAAWADRPPMETGPETLDRLKQVLAVHKLLQRLFPDPERRRRWMHEEDPALGAKPLDVMAAGDLERVQAFALEASRPHLGRENMPRY